MSRHSGRHHSTATIAPVARYKSEANAADSAVADKRRRISLRDGSHTEDAAPNTSLEGSEVGASFTWERQSTLYTRYGKRAFDVSIAMMGILVFLPLLAFTALLVRVALGRGIIYRQNRTGLNGETFAMLKFRTMRQDRRASSECDFRGQDRRISHKREDDPRHTPVGRFLRKYSIDELPQLFNVLQGTMSFVGPRPELSEIVARRGAEGHPRHLVRPGITGLWQVSARHEAGHLIDAFDDDLPYLQHMSLSTDLLLILRTVRVIATGTGR